MTGLVSTTAARRPARTGDRPAFRGVLAMVGRDGTERRFFGIGVVLDVVFGMVNLAVFLFISRVLHHPGRATPGITGRYFDFVAVGIIFSLVIQAAVTQLAGRVRDQQRNGTLELLAAEPLPVGTVAIGTAAYPFLFSVLRAAVYFALAAGLLGLDVGHADWVGVAVVLLVGGLATMSLGLALAAFTIAYGHGDAGARVLVVGLSFLSGTYFPTSALPAAVRRLGAPLPTRIALDGLRAALAGNAWAGRAALLAATGVVGIPAGCWLFGLAMRRGARRGTLTRV